MLRSITKDQLSKTAEYTKEGILCVNSQAHIIRLDTHCKSYLRTCIGIISHLCTFTNFIRL